MKQVLRLASGFIAFFLVGPGALVLSSTEIVSAGSLHDADSSHTLAQSRPAAENGDVTPIQVLSSAHAHSNVTDDDVNSAQPTQAPLSGLALVEALQKGGYVILFRHAQTEQNYKDTDATMGDCSTQRMLSAAGWQQARTIGQAFSTLNIPVGEVYASEYCRAWQTADLAFGHHETRPILNSLPDDAHTEEQTRQIQADILQLLATAPTDGTNTVIVGHYDVFSEAANIYLEQQGAASVVKPNGQGGFEVVSGLTSDEWIQLAQSLQQSTAQQSSGR